MKKNEMQFYQLLRDFLLDYLVTRRSFSDKTVRTYKQSLKQFRVYLQEQKGISFDSMDFSCFTRKLIFDFLVHLRDLKGCSVATINLRLSAIKAFLRFCSEEDLQYTSVYLDISSIHAFKGSKKASVEYLTSEQLKFLFAIPDVSSKIDRRDRFIMIFLYETGARIQELLDLTIGSIIRSGKTVKVRIYGKGAKIRYVPLMQSTVDHLDAYLKEFHPANEKDDYLFYTIHNRTHTQMTSGTVDYLLKKYGMMAHLKDENFPTGLHAHMVRHSIAMAMYKKGIPISYIKDFLGHTSIDTTAIYSYADDETIARALEAVDHMPATKSKTQKIWKGKEQYLLEFCGLD